MVWNALKLVGKEFGNLIVIERAENNPSRKSMWVCVCICGKECTVAGSHLHSGHTTSCGHTPVFCAHGHPRSPENLHPDGTCKLCQAFSRSSLEVKDKRAEESRRHYSENEDRRRREMRESAASLKSEVLTHYGPSGNIGCCWEGCTVVDLDMLSLDHVNNDGAEHRRRVGKNKTGEKMYRLVKQEGFPEGFQTLCMNHQTKKKLLNVRSKYE